MVQDIKQLYAGTSGWDLDYMQLSPGPLAMRHQTADCGEVRVERFTFNQAVLFHDVLRSGDLELSFAIDSETPPIYRGRACDPGAALIFHRDVKNDYLVAAGSTSLNVYLPEAFAATWAPELAPDPIRLIPGRTLRPLRRAIEAALEVGRQQDTTPAGPEVVAGLRERVLDALLNVLAAWLPSGQAPDNGDGEAKFRLVKRAQALMDTSDTDTKLNITALAGALGVSERGLYDAFQTCLRTGPYEYAKIHRLHRFRAALLDGQAYHGKVTRVAMACGFPHLSRLTEHYRRHFGETPRQTVQRQTIPPPPEGGDHVA